MPKRLYFIATFFFLITSFSISVFIYSSLKKELAYSHNASTTRNTIAVTTITKATPHYSSPSSFKKYNDSANFVTTNRNIIDKVVNKFVDSNAVKEPRTSTAHMENLFYNSPNIQEHSRNFLVYSR